MRPRPGLHSSASCAVAAGVVAVAALATAGCNAKKSPQAHASSAPPATTRSAEPPGSNQLASPIDAGATAAGTTVAPGTYKCTSYTFSQYGGGNLASAGYNLVVAAGNSYQSSMSSDAPGRMQFSDATHFTFVGGFLDGESGDYLPGATGHIDYHPADNSGRFGCYP